MRSLSLGSIGGTTLEIEPFFFVLLGFFVVSNYDQKQGAAYALIWIPVVIVSLLVHELAHAATIGAFGYGRSRIILGGMGGVTINERRGRPWHDALISAVGPASSLALAWVCTRLAGVPAMNHDPMIAALLPRLAYINVIWGEFNLLPMAPLDGGGIVRNLLRVFISDPRAFVVSVWISLVVGTAAGIWGLVFRHDPFLFVIFAILVRMNWQHWTLYRAFVRQKEEDAAARPGENEPKS